MLALATNLVMVCDRTASIGIGDDRGVTLVSILFSYCLVVIV